jgi:KUP system potassium uptake protein
MKTSVPSASAAKTHNRVPLPALALGALGIVFGDIGTSPLYALRESFHAAHGLAPTPANVLGILSLIFWALVVVISVKYLAFILRADNQGEGGILALTSLLIPPTVRRGSGRWLLILLGLFGTSLLYGDGIITPAISVLSAVEGLEVATPFFEPFVLPITIGILVALFAVQRFGTAGVGRVFGPVMLLWFAMLALLGIIHIVQAPGVLGAVNPAHALGFFLENGWRGFLVLGSVFLVVTGGEALYADMGHFGRQPIRLVWFVAVLPALVLNYLGQGALILRVPEAAENPFYGMIPVWGLYPAVILATMATVIASQALISGAFSLTMQAVQLGYAPYTHLRHTSVHSYGQIYIPAINWLLMFACIGLVLGFRSSSNLAAAYGAGVSTDMVITTILFYFVARERMRWPLLVALPVCLFFLVIDTAFFAANIVKVPQGGWFPYVVAVAVFTLLTTWKRGRAILAQRLDAQVTPLEVTLRELREHPPMRVPGTAVFLFRDPKGTPFSFVQNLKVNKVLHERVIFLSVKTENTPRVKLASRSTSDDLGDNFHQVVLHYGFMESPNVAGALRNLKLEGKKLDTDEVTYFLGRETLLASEHPGMAIWREKLFSLMARNAVSASVYYHLPPSQVVELGTRVEL